MNCDKYVGGLLALGAFGWLSLAVATAQPSPCIVHGQVYTSDSTGTRSMIPEAQVTISGPSWQKQAIADDHGVYTFSDLAPGKYRIEALSAGLSGSTEVTVEPGAPGRIEGQSAIQRAA